MKNSFATALLALSLHAGTALAAVTVKGVTFQDTDVVANQTLQLNGAGVRVKVIFDVYAASLYLPQKQQSAPAALSMPGAKSVHAVLLRDLTAAEFVEALVKGYKANNTEADQARLQPQLQALETMMLSTKNAPKGSRVRIELIPGTGTRIWFNDKRIGADIAGEDFYQCLMRIWLGNKPVDSDLKAALLGTS
ncbi:MAG TPA: chalcone isomerase family protein [Aquabacterium sp.]|nr:chalcone isomerase family protein [Aquabacterium sp.]HRH28535.1 chalcone isomerase family protein [Aquabacterium sp.]